jgi:hypothetical protein
MPLMGINEYARHRGCRPYSVQWAIKQGRINVDANKKINSEEADVLWELRTNHSMNARGKDSSHKTRNGALAELAGAAAESTTGGPNFSQARAVKEHYHARLAQLEFQEKSGKLVPSDQVKVEIFNRFRGLRDSILAIPNNVSERLAITSDPHEVAQILTSALHESLNDFANSNAG